MIGKGVYDAAPFDWFVCRHDSVPRARKYSYRGGGFGVSLATRKEGMS